MTALLPLVAVMTALLPLVAVMTADPRRRSTKGLKLLSTIVLSSFRPWKRKEHS